MNRVIDKSEAQKVASKVYERLLAQGRAEPQARRDAEKWVKGNYGVDVTLPAPSTAPTVRCARCGKGQRKLFWIEGELSRQESLCLDCIRRVAEATERRAKAAEAAERLRRDGERKRHRRDELNFQQEPPSKDETWVGLMIGGVFMAGVGVGVVFLIVWIISLFGH